MSQGEIFPPSALFTSAVNFSKRLGESNVYDKLKASGLVPREVIAALLIRTQNTGTYGEVKGAAPS